MADSWDGVSPGAREIPLLEDVTKQQFNKASYQLNPPSIVTQPCVNILEIYVPENDCLKFTLHCKSWSRLKHKGPENIPSSTVTQINKPFHKRHNAPCTRSVIQTNDNFMLPKHSVCTSGYVSFVQSCLISAVCFFLQRVNVSSGLSRLLLSSSLQICYFSEEVQCGTQIYKRIIRTTRISVTIRGTIFRYIYFSIKAIPQHATELAEFN